jgi:hypothetical protein
MYLYMYAIFPLPQTEAVAATAAAASESSPAPQQVVAKQIKRSLTDEFFDEFQGTHTHCSCGPKGGSFQITVCVGTVRIIL